MNRPDRIDLAPYYMSGYMLHKGQGHSLYKYKEQEFYLNKLFFKYSINKAHIPINTLTVQDKQVVESTKIARSYYYYPPNGLWLAWLWSLGSSLYSYLFLNFLSLSLLGLALFLGLKNIKNKFVLSIFLLSILCFQPFNHNVMHGQLSLFIALCFYFYYYFQKKQQNLLAGIFLSFTLLKPQLGLPLVLVVCLLKHYKVLFYFLISALVQFIIGLYLIGVEGYKDYFLAMFQLMGLYQSTLFVPIPSMPIYALQDLIISFFNPRGICLMKIKNLSSQITVLCQFAVLAFMLKLGFETLKNVDEKYSKIYKIALLSLLSLLLCNYHHAHDHNLFLIVVLILCDLGEAARDKVLLWFSFVGSILPSILVFIVGNTTLAYEYHFHTLWIVLLMSILGLIICKKQLLVSNNKLLNSSSEVST